MFRPSLMNRLARISPRPFVNNHPRLAAPNTFRLKAATMSSRSGTQQHPPAKKMAHFPRLDVQAAESPDFRRVLWTGEHSQLVIMTIPVGGEIGEEVHTVDQHLIFTSGSAKAVVAGEEKDIHAGDLVIVPAGTKHNFINSAQTPLILYTVYAPAEHATTSKHKTLDEGEKLEDDGKDEPPAWSQKGGN